MAIWRPRSVSGKVVCNAAIPFKAEVSTSFSAIDRLMVSAYAASNRLLWLRLSKSLNPWIRIASLGLSEPIPRRPRLPSGEIKYGITTLPTSNVLVPAIERANDTFELLFSDATRSAARPPHPVRISLRLGTLVIHWTAWSSCENRLPGTAAVPLM